MARAREQGAARSGLWKRLVILFAASVCCLFAFWPRLAQASSFSERQADAVARFGALRPQAWGEDLPGIQRSVAPQREDDFILALTLDACGSKGEGYDAELVAFLRACAIPATLFVSNAWINKHQAVFRELAADPLFEIAAHGARHRPASVNGRSAYGIRGTRSVADLVEEVEGNAELIHELGTIRPAWFRSGTAFYDDVAVRVIRFLNLRIAGYSIAADEGASLSAAGVEKRLLAAKPGDIILCHMNRPESGTRDGLRAALPQLLEQGARFVRLSEAVAPESCLPADVLSAIQTGSCVRP